VTNPKPCTTCTARQAAEEHKARIEALSDAALTALTETIAEIASGADGLETTAPAGEVWGAFNTNTYPWED
jgi:hypothetical protein